MVRGMTMRRTRRSNHYGPVWHTPCRAWARCPPPRARVGCAVAPSRGRHARRAGRAKIADVGLAHTVETTRIKDLEAVGACVSRQVSGVA